MRCFFGSLCVGTGLRSFPFHPSRADPRCLAPVHATASPFRHPVPIVSSVSFQIDKLHRFLYTDTQMTGKTPGLLMRRTHLLASYGSTGAAPRVLHFWRPLGRTPRRVSSCCPGSGGFVSQKNFRSTSNNIIWDSAPLCPSKRALSGTVPHRTPALSPISPTWPHAPYDHQNNIDGLHQALVADHDLCATMRNGWT